MQITDLIILALASFRLTHLLVFDRIAEPIRRLALRPAGRGTQTPDGEETSPAWTDLLTCYWCCGVWISAGVALSWVYLPQFSRVPITILAVAGAQAAIETSLRRSS